LLTTLYGYDALDQLLTVTDAKGNVTSTVYDTVGQMVTLTSPDAGRTEYRYDLGGNLREKQTPVLRGQSRFITYNYDADRLKTITYPSMPTVTYTYGDQTETGDLKGNRAGRIKSLTVEAGTETRSYDRFGNVSQTVTTLNNMSQASPPTVTFTMQYTWDWLGRMQDMTFPNWIDNTLQVLSGPGEIVRYFYDHGGNLDMIKGQYQTQNPQQPVDLNAQTPYLQHIGYDEFEQRTVLVSGNGIANKYSYEPTTRRLSDLTGSSLGAQERQLGKPATPFHKMHYTYDKNSNVLHNCTPVDVGAVAKFGAAVAVGAVLSPVAGAAVFAGLCLWREHGECPGAGTGYDSKSDDRRHRDRCCGWRSYSARGSCCWCGGRGGSYWRRQFVDHDGWAVDVIGRVAGDASERLCSRERNWDDTRCIAGRCRHVQSTSGARFDIRGI